MNTLIPKHTKKVQDRFRKLLEGETVESLKGTDLETKKHSQRALAANKFPKMTVVSIPDDYVHYDITMPRTFSVRECARLQTFPDHFHFYRGRGANIVSFNQVNHDSFVNEYLADVADLDENDRIQLDFM